MKSDVFNLEIENVFKFLESIIQKNDSLTDLKINSSKISNSFGMSGVEFDSKEFNAELTLGMILGGTGFIIRRVREGKERYDYFGIDGNLTFSSDKEVLKPLIVDQYEMDLSCPFLNHFYNFLSYEYKLASEGKSSTPLVHKVESFLNQLYSSNKFKLPIKLLSFDSAIIKIFEKMLVIEKDPVLTWEERQLIFQKKFEVIKHILKTKVRAHKLNSLRVNLSLLRQRIDYFISRFFQRPQSNLNGILYKYTIGKILWFFRTVKNNLGYSVALAVYGPFTYYFITMPMNPHAMQAVGKVRATYLVMKEEVGTFISESISPKKISANTTLPITLPERKDLVSTTQAASAKDSTLANVIFTSQITSKNNPVELNIGENQTSVANPTYLNMLLSTDAPVINEQSWTERMSSFKQMQIAYEENIEYASRMGRLEQLETQYNFPMQVEQTWDELERYNNLIFKARSDHPNLSPKMKQYLYNEVNRTQQLQLYLWDRLGRFILDQIYVMLDQDQEQLRNDFYVGKSFILMDEMTQTLSWRYQNFKRPVGFEKIEKLATFYRKNRKEFNSISKNLIANSTLFKQKNTFDTAEFRAHMKRQWEILFLQNAKAEEAANMGLNMYIWSVRNTIWILQSIFSTKRDELALLIKRDTSGTLLTNDELAFRSKATQNYESLFHNLVLEYVGIKEEIKNRLGKDIESAQRLIVIENLKEFFTDREKLDGLVTSTLPIEKTQTAKVNL